jgi:2'-5' RNA ligase
MTIKNLDRITADYERMWNDSRRRLRAGNIEPDPVPGDQSRRWGVSAIIRPAGVTLTRLAGAADELKAFAGDQQVVYGRSNLHTTVRSIERHRIDVDVNDEKISQYKEALQKILRRFRPIKVAYRGLTSDCTSVMAQGWPIDDTLQEIRDAFHAELQRRALLSGPEKAAVRQTSHASLIVFTHALAHAEKLADHVRDNRNTDYGTCEVNEIDLVRYSRTESSVTLVVFASVGVGG